MVARQKQSPLDPTIEAAVRTAAEYARYLGSRSVEPEHLLLGFLRTGRTLFRQASNAAIREAILERVQRSTPIDPAQELPFSPGAVRALRLTQTANEAPALRPEDVLLEIMNDPRGVAASVLASFGITSREDMIPESER
jgi:ATP-dependent Clp protease ATP-binding subunit ClpA